MTSSPSPKRRKITRACDCCRAQKKRCTGTVPCDSCVRNSKHCTFLASYTRGRAVTPPPSAASVMSTVTPSPSLTQSLTTATSPRTINRTPRPSSLSVTHLPETQASNHVAQCPPIHSRGTWQSHGASADFSRRTGLRDEVSEPASDEELADGNFVGPGSAHSWLKQAWSCLGRVRQHVFRLHSTLAASGPPARVDGPIFSHGDKALKDDHVENTRLPQLSPGTMEVIIATYFDRGLATYRFLHRPTVMKWLDEMQDQNEDSKFPAVRSAIVLLLLALGSSHLLEKDKASLPPADAEILRNEVFFYKALRKISEERGPPSVESVQARLLQTHYLLSSSRPNRAWYAFGTVVQLVFALGLHQKNYARQNAPGLARELRRRAFWSVYKTDKSLSIALGRPSLIREECITQEFPEAVNDEQLFPDHIAPTSESDDDCLLEADLFQVKLARIVGRSMREYYETDDNALVQLIMSNNERLAEWRAQLPPFLSGTVKPSSLIPVLRRQATILKIFQLHTVIFINRPLLLKSFSEAWSLQNDSQIQSSIDSCISAAAEIAKQAVQFTLEGQAFRAFWFSQNITFNAISILYLNSLRSLQGKSSLSSEEHAMVAIAERAQESLTNASKGNAPGQRYGIVLEQLRLEVRAHIDNNGVFEQTPEAAMGLFEDHNVAKDFGVMSEGLDWANMISGTSLNDASTFWPQFDGLPLGFDDWLGADFIEPMSGIVE